MYVRDPGGTTVFHQHSRNRRSRQYCQVASSGRRPKIGPRGARAPTFPVDRDFAFAKAGGLLKAEIARRLVAGQSCRPPDGIASQSAAIHPLHAQGPMSTVYGTRASPATLHFAEV